MRWLGEIALLCAFVTSILAVLSLVTASLSALFVEREVEQEDLQIEQDLMREIRALRRQVELLHERIDRQTAADIAKDGR